MKNLIVFYLNNKKLFVENSLAEKKHNLKKN